MTTQAYTYKRDDDLKLALYPVTLNGVVVPNCYSGEPGVDMAHTRGPRRSAMIDMRAIRPKGPKISTGPLLATEGIEKFISRFPTFTGK